MLDYLKCPLTRKASGENETVSLRFGFASMQGWRASMEDAHIVRADLVPGVGLFAVFDGHGGAAVARFCEKFFADVLRKNAAFIGGRYRQALEESFLKMDELLGSPAGAAQLEALCRDAGSPRRGVDLRGSMGCTAVVTLITPSSVICASAGDSRAYIIGASGAAVALTRDHRPEDPVEAARVRGAGGKIADGRVNETLNLTRAIGDLDLKKNKALKPEEQIISAFPEVREFPLNPRPQFLLLGCDGVFESLPPPKLIELTSDSLYSAKLSPAKTAEKLLDAVIGSGPNVDDEVGCDNMTAIIVQFK